ncbi:MAG: hypothetical protein OXJ64_04805 [Boseongicola sp.]|nr:hypothetical protein [Boseongicola sp.]
MRLIEGAQADAELKNVERVDGLEAASPTFPLADLSPVDFELLNYALFKNSSPVDTPRNWDDAALMLTGADEGRDILLLGGGAAPGVVQCKRRSAAMTRPAVLRELSKCILFCTLDTSTPPLSPHAHYFLSLTRDPAGTVLDFFAQPARFLSSHPSDVSAAVRDTLEEYGSLHALDLDDALSTVDRYLRSMTLHLLRPVDLHFWIARKPDIARLFFRHRVVVDNDPLMQELGALRGSVDDIARQTSGISAITDDDVKIIKDYIDGVPESHRTSLGIASLFGFPREMFAGEENFQKHLDSLLGALQVLHTAYIDWMNSRAHEEAARICDLPEIRFTVHPFALQIAPGYMGTLAADISLRSLSGEAMSAIIEKVTKRKAFSDDDERLAHVCERVLDQGGRHLARDYSQLAGDHDLVAFKRQLFDRLMADIPDRTILEDIVQDGRRKLEPYLKQASSDLQSLGGFRPSVFLAGTSGLDSDIAIAKMANTARSLEDLGAQDDDG